MLLFVFAVVRWRYGLRCRYGVRRLVDCLGYLLARDRLAMGRRIWLLHHISSRWWHYPVSLLLVYGSRLCSGRVYRCVLGLVAGCRSGSVLCLLVVHIRGTGASAWRPLYSCVIYLVYPLPIYLSTYLSTYLPVWCASVCVRFRLFLPTRLLRAIAVRVAGRVLALGRWRTRLWLLGPRIDVAARVVGGTLYRW
jgi:hypothetical protein